jgi:hypothetical protein
MTDVELEAELRKLVRASARTEAKVVAHLAEVEARRLHLQAGFGSMFEYCLEHLGLGDFEAFLRITAARTATKYPVVLDLLERQELHLTAIRLLREHLTDENHRDLLMEACGKSKRQIEALVARRFPKCAVPERLCRLPKLEPLAPGRYRLELTIDEELKERLELARDLLSHANPTHDLAMVIGLGIDALLERLQRRRFGRTSRPRKAEAEAEARPRGKRRWVPNGVRRPVVERDGLRCAFIGTDGRRCTSRAFLQLHHGKPWAWGGRETPKNLHVFCAQHNRLRAEQDFGREHIARAIAARAKHRKDGRPANVRHDARPSLPRQGKG